MKIRSTDVDLILLCDFWNLETEVIAETIFFPVDELSFIHLTDTHDSVLTAD